MPEPLPEPIRHPFAYAIVRVVPRVERGESMNAGIVLLCRPRQFLGARVWLDEARLGALDPTCDADEVRSHLVAIERIAAGRPGRRADRGARARPSATTGSWPRRRRSSSPRRPTRA